MKKISFAIIALLAMMVSCRQETKKEAAEPTKSIQTFSMARALAQYGYENESAEALIEAANIMADMNLSAVEKRPERSDSGCVKGLKAPVMSYAIEDMLAAARTIAGDDSTLLAMIEKVENKVAAAATDSRRGSAPGLFWYQDAQTLSEYGWAEYSIDLEAGDFFSFTVFCDEPEKIHTVIRDTNGDIIYNDKTDDFFTMNVATTGIYKLKITNKTDADVDYRFAYEVDRIVIQ